MSLKKIASSFTLLMCSITSGFATEPDCIPQKQLDVTKIDRQIMLVGEVHGTNEIPAFTAGLVCSLLRSGKSVILGIEHEGEEQEVLNRYLLSNGDVKDREALLQSSHNWRTYSDGRGSVAMFEMIDTMRQLRRQGQRVGVLALQRNDNLDVPMEAADSAMIPPADNALLNRLNDEDMANSILDAALLYRRYVIVVLAGFSHTSTVLQTSTNPAFGDHMPMGQIVSGQQTVYTVGLDSDGGESSGSGPDGDKIYSLSAGPRYDPATTIDVKVHLGRLTASPPARDTIK